jgi:hypothetical protein
MPLILPGNVGSAVAGAYEVANSCRFNSGDSPGLVQTPSAGNADRWTLSMWFKRCDQAASQRLLTCVNGSNYTEMGINASDILFWNEEQSGVQGALTANRKIRDVSAWMHLVFTWDSANGVAGNRMRLYINGTEETSFSTDTNPSSGQDSVMGTAYPVAIGSFNNQSNYQGSYFAEVAYCNGQAYAASDFGEFDDDSPTIWKPKDISGLTYGTGGFYLDFEDSSALGKDVSGQGNDFTVSNLAAADQATDTPTNNFCVMNPLDNYIAAATFTEGNCNLVHPSSSNNAYCTSTFWLSSGKWYAEAKVSTSAGSDNNLIGISSVVSPSADNDGSLGQTTENYSYLGDGGGYRYNNSTTSYGSGYGANAVIGVYLDLDNNKLYFAEDGTIQASGTGISITAAASQPSGLYTISGGDWSSSTGVQWSWNFGGCPSFAISSGNADAEGYGNFEYSPNDGGGSSFDSAAKNFLAICTKNLAEYGG